MKKMGIAVGLFLTCFLLGGCLQSLNPFFTDDAKVAMPELNGKWTMLDDAGRPKSQKDWVFEDGRIMTYSEKGGSGILVATWFKVGDQLYVDTTAASLESDTVSDWWIFHVMPVHILCKVERDDKRLTFKPLDLEWVKQALTNGVVSLPVVKGKENDMVLFSTEPEQWMQFLKRQGTNEDAFAGGNEVTFVRSQERVRIQEP
jgi:hypothetical protein